MEKIKVLIVEPFTKPYAAEIENTLEAKQMLVGGYIQMVHPPCHEDDAVIICNDEGKLMHLAPNRWLRMEDGRMYDFVAGTFIILDAPPESEDFASLSEEQIETYSKMYEKHLNLEDLIMMSAQN